VLMAGRLSPGWLCTPAGFAFRLALHPAVCPPAGYVSRLATGAVADGPPRPCAAPRRIGQPAPDVS